jgi:hypothetical protein
MRGDAPILVRPVGMVAAELLDARVDLDGVDVARVR